MRELTFCGQHGGVVHPFIQQIELATTEKHSARVVQLHVSFGLHTFTRAVEAHDRDDDLRSASIQEGRTKCGAPDGAIGVPTGTKQTFTRQWPNPLSCAAWPCATRHDPATSALIPVARSSETRNPACSGVSSVRVHLPATGADLLRGGRAPSRLLCTFGEDFRGLNGD